ncbi:MAG: enoyl-CoA hydratase/isomerase family protein [Bacteroidota bacterium]
MDFIKTNRKKDYAIVQLSRGKVNAINHQMVEEIRATFRELEADDSVRGVILTGIPRYFSAGLDVIELYGYDKEKMDAFFISFGSMHIEMAQFSKPLIGAITGHSPAGGCVMAICCDHRIMADGEEFTIGLNEVEVNIQISQNIINAYSFWLGTGPAHKHILSGKLLKVKEALRAGLVDESCPVEEVLPTAEKRMKALLQANQNILVNTKAKLRHSWLSQINDQAGEDLKMAREAWWSPDVRARMGMFVEYLKNRSKAKV